MSSIGTAPRMTSSPMTQAPTKQALFANRTRIGPAYGSGPGHREAEIPELGLALAALAVGLESLLALVEPAELLGSLERGGFVTGRYGANHRLLESREADGVELV